MITDNLNEKILITILVTEQNILMKFFEEISNIKLSNDILDKKKNEIIQVFSENNFEKSEKLKLESLFSDDSLNEINYLKNTHLSKIDENDKEIFFSEYPK